MPRYFALEEIKALTSEKCELRSELWHQHLSRGGACRTLKSELIWRTVLQTRHDAEIAMARYIEGFYNPIRCHSSLEYLSAVQFEPAASRHKTPLHFSEASPYNYERRLKALKGLTHHQFICKAVDNRPRTIQVKSNPSKTGTEYLRHDEQRSSEVLAKEIFNRPYSHVKPTHTPVP